MDTVLILRDENTTDIIGVFDTTGKSIADIKAYVKRRQDEISQQELEEAPSDVDIILDELKLTELETIEWYN